MLHGAGVPPRVDGGRRRGAGGGAGEDSGSGIDDDVAGGGVLRGVSTCAMNARNASREVKSAACPDTICSTRPCSASGVSAVPSRNCTTKAQGGERGLRWLLQLIQNFRKQP